MRLVGLGLSLLILLYIISVYMKGSEQTTEQDNYMSQPQQTIEHAQDTADQLNKTLQEQQEKLKQQGE